MAKHESRKKDDDAPIKAARVLKLKYPVILLSILPE